MRKTIKLSMIIPVFNEEKTIAKIINYAKNAKIEAKNAQIVKEIVVVDDASTDQTPKILKKIKKEIKIKIFTHKKNQGKGAAVRTGLKHASGDIFIIQDADLEYNPKDYPKLLKPLINRECEVVYGTRMRLKRPPEFYVSLLGNKLLTWSTNLLYRSNLSDVFVGYKAFTKKALEGIKLKSKGFNIEIELTAKFLKKGLEIYEVPISYHGRSWREGKKITFKDGLQALFDVFRYRLKD